MDDDKKKPDETEEDHIQFNSQPFSTFRAQDLGKQARETETETIQDVNKARKSRNGIKEKFPVVDKTEANKRQPCRDVPEKEWKMIEQKQLAKEMLKIPQPNFDKIKTNRDKGAWLKRWVIFQNILRLIEQHGECTATTLQEDPQFLTEIQNIRGKEPEPYISNAMHQDIRKTIEATEFIEKNFGMSPWLHKKGGGQQATYFVGPDPSTVKPKDPTPPVETVTLDEIVDGGETDEIDTKPPELQDANLEGVEIPEWLKVQLKGLSQTLESGASHVTILGSLININLHYHSKK